MTLPRKLGPSPRQSRLARHLLQLRERTDRIEVETSYCSRCYFNDPRNIGHADCQRCGQPKGTK